MDSCTDWLRRNMEWQKERGLLEHYNVITEYRNLLEECEELMEADSVHEQVDAYADIIVFATAALMKLGYRVNDVMHEVMTELESRTGSIDDSGKWQKDKGVEVYKADYSKCKRGTPHR